MITQILLIWLAVSIICYIINRKISRKEYNPYTWEDVNFNIFFSIVFPLSFIIWIARVSHKMPGLPENPPRWL